MKLSSAVHPDKLRGGFYTKPHLVDFCLDRILALRSDWGGRWLEPSAGDGAFFRGIARRVPQDLRKRIRITGVELEHAEAEKCAKAASDVGVAGKVVCASFFEWAFGNRELWDVVIGNPPFVRYQFVTEEDRHRAEAMVAELGLSLRGVSNLWIPFVLVALRRISTDGCFALVLPSEMFCTTSGGQFREFLIQHFTDLSIDLFPKGTFPGILQDVVVASGRRAARAAEARLVRFTEHHPATPDRWQHHITCTQESWLQFLLTDREHAAYSAARSLTGFHRLGDLARLEVAIVTGANSFFTVTDATAATYDLHDWLLPLLARTSDSPGVVFYASDHDAARARGSRAWLLHFSEHRPMPNGRGKVSAYLALGEAEGLPQRFKCRIRKPWYRVPHVKCGVLMMTKRAHHYHRLLLNRAGAYTTDTIYRGEMHELFRGREADLVASFQNTLTLLSSEIEGRTYGGGVLELVPSEVARLSVPLCKTGNLLERVDDISRSVNGQRDSSHSVMLAVDEFLGDQLRGYSALLHHLDSARRRLQARRQAQVPE